VLLGPGQRRRVQSGEIGVDDDIDLIIDRPGEGDQLLRAGEPQASVVDAAWVVLGRAPPVEVTDGGVDGRTGQGQAVDHEAAHGLVVGL